MGMSIDSHQSYFGLKMCSISMRGTMKVRHTWPGSLCTHLELSNSVLNLSCVQNIWIAFFKSIILYRLFGAVEGVFESQDLIIVCFSQPKCVSSRSTSWKLLSWVMRPIARIKKSWFTIISLMFLYSCQCWSPVFFWFRGKHEICEKGTERNWQSPRDCRI